MVPPSMRFDKPDWQIQAQQISTSGWPLLPASSGWRQGTGGRRHASANKIVLNGQSRRMAEAGDLRAPHQVAEIRAAHVHQRPVIAAFEIDVADIAEAFV